MKGLSESDIAEMWRTAPNPQPMADQIPNPEWEDLLRLDDITGKLVPRASVDSSILTCSDPGSMSTSATPAA